MKGNGRELRIGLIVVIGVVLSAVVLVVFSGMEFWQRRDHYSIHFEGSVYGLESGSEVYVEGVRVGTVSELEISDELGGVDVEIAVDVDTPIRANARAVLVFAGLTGLRVVDLNGGTSAAPLLASGSAIPPGKSDLDRIMAGALGFVESSNQLVEHTDHVILRIAEIADGEDLRGLLTDARAAAADLAATSTQLRAFIRDNRGSATRITTSMSDAIGHLDRLASSLEDRVHADGDEIHSMVGNLREASRSLKELARDLRNDPSRLLLSRPRKERKLP